MGVQRKTGYDILVDDAPHNVLLTAEGGGLALVMDHPYNRRVPELDGLRRVHDWMDVEHEVLAALLPRLVPA
jgi:5'(3')-deoxyribonucleotidase